MRWPTERIRLGTTITALPRHQPQKAHTVFGHHQFDLDSATAERPAHLVGEPGDFPHAGYRRLEADADTLAQLVAQHRLVDEPGGLGVLVDRWGVQAERSEIRQPPPRLADLLPLIRPHERVPEAVRRFYRTLARAGADAIRRRRHEQ